jgi:hypothetical protein
MFCWPSLLNHAEVQKSYVFSVVFTEVSSLSSPGANSVTDSDLRLLFPTKRQCHFMYMPLFYISHVLLSSILTISCV